MPRFADLTVSAFLDAVASSEPTPGGGTAAAMAGGIGVSLLMMVAGLPRSRTDEEAEKAALRDAAAALVGLRERVVALADVDATAFNQVMAAYRLPKSSESEATARTQAVQSALRAATEAPRDTLAVISEAVGHSRVIAQHGNRRAVSDVRVALELLEGAAAGAAANVEVNLPGVGDETFRKTMAADTVELANRVSEDLAAARAALGGGQVMIT